MGDPGAARSTWWMAVGLWTAGAACGPLPPAGGATEGSTSSPTSSPTSDPTAPPPTGGTTEVDPTAGPECEDCFGVCEYCDNGKCVDSPGCCGYDYTADGAREWRCSPYYADCYYSDDECDIGEVCQDLDCVAIPQIPACERQTLLLSAIPLADAPAAVRLVDVDGDGDNDLVAVEPAAGAVEIALNDGVGGFADGFSAPSGLFGDEPQHLDVGDLDGDGDLDLAVVRAAPVGELSLLFGQDGILLAPVILSMGQAPTHVLAAPIDDDPWPDILVIDGPNGNTFTLRSGDGIDAFGPEVAYAQVDGHVAAVPGALEDDSKFGIFAAIFLGPLVHLYSHTASGFAAGPSYPGTGWTPFNAVFVTDAYTELPPVVVATRRVSGVGTISAWRTTIDNFAMPDLEVAIPQGLRGVAFADVDADGRRDLVALPDESGTQIRVVYSGPTGPECWQSYALAHPTTAALVSAGDVDGDGKADIIAADPQGPSATLLRATP